MVVSGVAWLCVILHGFVWICKVLHGYTWLYVVSWGFAWFDRFCMVSCVLFYVFCLICWTYSGFLLHLRQHSVQMTFEIFSLYKYPEIIFKLRLLMRCSFYIVFYMIDYFILVVLYPFGSIHTYIERKCDTIHILYIIYFLIFCTHLWSTCQKSSDFFLMIWVAIGPFIPK